jgi:ABC-type glycerol-3-phosphate transport system substrate-binding protein
MKTVQWLTASVLISGLVLGGCSSDKSGSEPSPAGTAAASAPAASAAGEAKELVEKGASLKVWGSKSVLDKPAQEFEKKFGIKVEVEEVGLKDNELRQFMLSKVAAKQTADISVLDLGGDGYNQFYDKKVFLSYNDWIERDGLKNWPWAQKDIFQYLPYNGQIYYLPTGSVVYGLWYNVELAKKYGIYDQIPKSFDDPSYKNWTWNNYAELLKKATVDTNGDGKTDIYGTDDNFGWGRTDWAASVGVYTDLIENGRMMAPGINFVKPEAIEALQFMSDLALVHKVAPHPDVDVKADGINIENEKVVIRRMGSWAFDYFDAKANPEREKAGKKPIEYAFTMYPHKEGMEDQFRVHGFTGQGPKIFAATPYPKAAWEFVKFLHSPEYESANYDLSSVGTLPSFTDNAALAKLKQQVGEINAQIMIELGEHLIKEGSLPVQQPPQEMLKQYPAGQKPLEKLNAQIPDLRKGKLNYKDIIPPLFEQQYNDYKEAWTKYDAASK